MITNFRIFENNNWKPEEDDFVTFYSIKEPSNKIGIGICTYKKLRWFITDKTNTIVGAFDDRHGAEGYIRLLKESPPKNMKYKLNNNSEYAFKYLSIDHTSNEYGFEDHLEFTWQELEEAIISPSTEKDIALYHQILRQKQFDL